MDIVFLIILAFFLYRGYRRGIILALFSVLALGIGLLGAMKLSGSLALKLSATYPDLARWLPLISYLLVFIGLVWIIRLVGKMAEKAVSWLVLGWLNRLGGAVLYGFLACLAGSLLLWLLEQLLMLPEETLRDSRLLALIRPLAPGLAGLMMDSSPILKQWFQDLSSEFESLNRQIGTHVGLN